jgi:hypothetical protein
MKTPGALDALTGVLVACAFVLLLLWALHENPHVTQVLFGEPRVIYDIPVIGGDGS